MCIRDRIYTDVEGVYTADPRKIPKATRLKEITFDEMLEPVSYTHLQHSVKHIVHARQLVRLRHQHRLHTGAERIGCAFRVFMVPGDQLDGAVQMCIRDRYYLKSDHQVLDTDRCLKLGLSTDKYNAVNQSRDDVWRDWPTNRCV